MFFYTNKVDYQYLSSPNSTQKLIIVYSNWSLGETNRYYDFYRQTGFALVKKRLNQEPLHVMILNTDMSDLNVLGAHDAQWENEQAVTFTSPHLNKEVTLSLK
ncbi:hypothetical protein C1N83_27955 (plasmid) [Priestia aryabhattai]